jgi:hypothetical protein
MKKHTIKKTVIGLFLMFYSERNVRYKLNIDMVQWTYLLQTRIMLSSINKLLVNLVSALCSIL